MKRLLFVIALLLLVVGCEYEIECPPECSQFGINTTAYNCPVCTTCPVCANNTLDSAVVADNISIMPYACPVDDCRQAVINEIDKANTYIKIAMFSFTDDAVGEALVRAANRGVQVEVLLELGQISEYSEAPKLIAAGISVRQDTNSQYMHNKYVVIDDKVLMTGSVNYSANGFDNNNENMVVITDTNITEKYRLDFDRIYATGIDWVG